MEMIMFTSPGCKYCELVKKRMPPQFVDKVHYYDCTLKENENLVAYYSAYHAVRKALPVLVVDEELFVGPEAALKRLRELDENGA
jgi:glutaredoxin